MVECQLPKLDVAGSSPVSRSKSQGLRVEGACGVAFFVALMSTIQNRRIQAGPVVLSDLTIQGNLKGVPSITEPVQVALENGGLRVGADFQQNSGRRRAIASTSK